MEIKDKVAIVTGAARGLGKAFSKALLQNGARVCMLDIADDNGNKTLDEFTKLFGGDRVIYVHCDVTDDAQFRNAFTTTVGKFGRLDIVINNAGMNFETDWSKVVDLNVKGVMRGTLLALDNLRTDKGGNGGVIVNISSQISGFEADTQPIFPSYCATKYAIVGYTKSWSQNRYALDNDVRVHCLCPGPVNSELCLYVEGMAQGDEKAFRTMMDAYTFIEPETVGDALVQLLTDGNNPGICMAVYGKGTEVIVEYM